LRGNLTASDRVDIRSDGSTDRDVVAARISMRRRLLQGGIDIRKGGQPTQTQTQSKPNGKDEGVTATRPAGGSAAARVSSLHRLSRFWRKDQGGVRRHCECPPLCLFCDAISAVLS